MAEINAALVAKLRGMTGAGMMECKKALGEAKGDLNAALIQTQSGHGTITMLRPEIKATLPSSSRPVPVIQESVVAEPFDPQDEQDEFDHPSHTSSLRPAQPDPP